MTEEQGRLPLIVRPPQGPAEIDDYFLLAASVFGETPEDAVSWRDQLMGSAGFDISQVRCVYHQDQLLGGCIVNERLMRMGLARLRTGCIFGVATHPSFRHQGVASAFMRDATAYARSCGMALLLLDGIPDFYARFGYVDIYDATVHAITWKSALDGSPPSLCRVRPATLEDAPALLDLYLRHYGRYPGRFERTLEQQAYWLRWSHPEQAPQLAIAPDGSVCGYLTLRHWQPASVKAREVAADDWPAALALLQHHAHTFDGQPEASAELLWPLPTDSATYFTLADHLPLHTRVEVQPNEGWQARPARLSELFRSLLPWWQALWRRQALQWKGHLGIRIEDEESSADSEACLLALSSGHVEMVAAPPAESVAWVRLSPGTFIQLLFGYRPVEWAASQPGREVPHELRPVMAALFEGERFWIPGTDTF